ncbi:MAG: type VI secretion system contractile sheath large subunit, partial [Gemmatimonadota bacterium]|nr:type VI secretion system contractile sheath large subunit [Gemmatimonadota bacterium]
FFRETEGDLGHGDFLWGSPAILVGLVLAQGFLDHGWDLRPAAPDDVGGLPFHVTTEHGETRAQPCAEVLITESEARRMIEAGLTPVVAFRDQDRVKLLGVHPIADTPFPLAGPWLDRG